MQKNRARRSAVLLALEAGAEWTLGPPSEDRESPWLIEDETRPPSRYRPHSLIRAVAEMEDFTGA